MRGSLLQATEFGKGGFHSARQEEMLEDAARDMGVILRPTTQERAGGMQRATATHVRNCRRWGEHGEACSVRVSLSISENPSDCLTDCSLLALAAGMRVDQRSRLARPGRAQGHAQGRYLFNFKMARQLNKDQTFYLPGLVPVPRCGWATGQIVFGLCLWCYRRRDIGP